MKIRTEAVPIILGLGAALLLSACDPVAFNVHANGTVAPAHSSPAPASSSAPENPSQQPSISPSADIPGATVQPTQSVMVTSSQVESCLSPVLGSDPQQTSVQLESAQTWGNLQGCLQVPTAEFDQFVAAAVKMVINAERQGQFTDQQSCQQWEDDTLTPVVQEYG